MRTERLGYIGTRKHPLKMAIQVINLSRQHHLTLTGHTRTMTKMRTQIYTPGTHRVKQLISEIHRHTRTPALSSTRHPHRISRTTPKHSHTIQRHIALRQSTQSRPDNQRTTLTPHRTTHNTMVTSTHRHGDLQQGNGDTTSVPTHTDTGKQQAIPYPDNGGKITEGRVIWPAAGFRAI